MTATGKLTSADPLAWREGVEGKIVQAQESVGRPRAGFLSG